MPDSQTYFKQRNQALKLIQADMRSDNSYKGALTKLYNNAQDEIRRDISADIAGFERREQLSMAEARKRIKKMDVEGFSGRAKRYVEEKDFSPRANEELATYNVTMRTNRLELLEAKMHLHTVALANEEEGMLQRHLAKKYLEEYERQAGILGISVPSQNQLDRLARVVVEAEFRGVNFSENIWQNQKELQAELETMVRRTVIRGENPRVSSRRIRDILEGDFKTRKFYADRIALTETARVQGEAQKKSFEDGGYSKYLYTAEPGACSVCKPLDGKVFKLKDMEVGVNMFPMHSFCRCRVSAVE